MPGPGLHRKCALFLPPELKLNLDRDAILVLLNDPLDYHWPELKSSIMGALAALAVDSKAHGRLQRLRWRQLLHFLACVFAAKWILDAPGNTLRPIEGGFSFPRDTGWLFQLMESFGFSGEEAPPELRAFEFEGGPVPWPTGFNPDDYPAKTELFFDMEMAWMDSSAGVATYVGPHFESDPPKSYQDLIDRTIRLTGGYPCPGSVHDIAHLAKVTGYGPASVMEWVWSDDWSPERLAQDLKNTLLPLRLRLESVLLDVGEQSSRVAEHLVLDLVPLLRQLFRRLLHDHFGDDWLRDAVKREDQKALLDMWVENRREGNDFDYAEIPLLERLANKHWAHVFEPFLIHCSGSPKAALKKPEFLKLIGDLIPIRNASAHRRRRLTSQERALVREVNKRLLEWRYSLSGYSAGRSG